MTTRITRRHLLAGAAALAGAAGGTEGVRAARTRSVDGAFDPAEHGYGFRNWSTRDQYFDSPIVRSRRSVRERIRTEWNERARTVLDLDTDPFPEPLLDAVTAQVRTAIVQRAGTNGHCYGMVLTAQQYFEDPSSIPVDRRVASEIEDPTVPIEDPATPVYDGIVERQAAQYLRFRAWLGRRAMVRPEWIDASRLLGDVRSVVEAFGTATLSLFDDDLSGHQVLAYGYEEDGGGVRVPIYDPNRAATSYRGERPTLRFDRSGGALAMRAYGRYTHVLFNRYDQIERATGRGRASPLDHLRVGPSTVHESLFPVVVVTTDTEDAELAVVAPDGTELQRIRGGLMDGSRGDLARLRSLYGADSGTYRVGVFGTRRTDYELRALAADADGAVVRAVRTGTVGSGELHEYALDVPEDGDGTMVRERRGGVPSGLVGGAGAIGGVAVGVASHRAFQRLRSRDRPG